MAPSGSRTGPPLEHLERNSYIAGILPMNADNLARWIMHPRAIHPHSAMPELGISAQDAADMSAYLRSVDQSSTP